jgi:hypothetical protein
MQRKIVALTDKNSTTWEVVDGKLGYCYEHNDIEGIKNTLITTWKAWKNKERNYFYNEDLDMNFSAKENAHRLAQLFKNIMNGDLK